VFINLWSLIGASRTPVIGEAITGEHMQKENKQRGKGKNKMKKCVKESGKED
jgi:hypothetical protein